MKRYKHIKAGDTIMTLEGYIIINSITVDGLAYADEYIDQEEGEAKRFNELMLTAPDIARRMREYDGKNHNIILEAR